MGSKKRPKLDNELYEAELNRLQAELVEMQEWLRAEKKRLVVIFEGRDAAGKGGAIKRITEYLNPRVARIVALPAPTERETTQWYFQRYIEHLPAGGEMRLFDRSWYNRAGVERVMGYCTPVQYQRFLRQCPIFEQMLIEDGIILRKYWFSVSDKEQEKRFRSRMHDPMRRWKLSPTDLESLTKWEEYSRAKDDMFIHTDVDPARWTVVEAEDKKRARINMIAHLLDSIPYKHVPMADIKFPKRPPSTGYKRTDRTLQEYVPDVADILIGTEPPPVKYVDPEDSPLPDLPVEVVEAPEPAPVAVVAPRTRTRRPAGSTASPAAESTDNG
ncbi:MAG TPA: polyphosphate kinase 2 [Propionibacteriaceae bacterium]|nr:polyphosphate kinase 2 [Micropruina sp.]HBY23682.1 polyphosphate kinase 2 [Propionibacteriaceae bacterium]